MWSVKNSVGNLVEARLNTMDSEAIAACLSAIVQLVAVAPAPVVGILDLSRVRVFGREDANQFVSVMREDNPRVKRTAIIVNGDPLFGMQMQRLVRAATSPRRQVFRMPSQALGWLAEVLGDAEIARLRAFILE